MKSAGGNLAFNIMHFARVLREAGVPVGPSAVIDALDAVRLGVIQNREDFFWALHAIFVKRRDHHEIFEQAFYVFWKRPKILERLMKAFLRQAPAGPNEAQKKAGGRRLAEALAPLADVLEQPKPKEDQVEIDMTLTASAQEVLGKKDFEQMSTAELADARKAIARMRMNPSLIATRRFRPSHRGNRADLRRMMREAVHGNTFEIPRKARVKREPPLVVLCDISGSCSDYSRVFLHFLHALSNDRARVRVFLFGTRLTHVTRDLKRRDVDDAMARVSAAAPDWSGGTKLGATLHEFNFKWGRRVLGQGAHVLLMSDGLEREDADHLAQEMQHLKRSAKHVTFLNPLLRYQAFEPFAAGIRAILPHVNEFRPVHNLNSLSDLARSLAGRARPEHDPKIWMERAHGHA